MAPSRLTCAQNSQGAGSRLPLRDLPHAITEGVSHTLNGRVWFTGSAPSCPHLRATLSGVSMKRLLLLLIAALVVTANPAQTRAQGAALPHIQAMQPSPAATPTAW